MEKQQTAKEANRSKKLAAYRAIKERVEFAVGKKLTDGQVVTEVKRLILKAKP